MPRRQRSTYDEIWRATVPERDRRALVRSTGYSQRELVQGHLEIFTELDNGMSESDAERYQLWNDYLRAFAMPSSRDERNGFLNFMGIHPSDFPWSEWREVMGYGNN